MEARCCLAGSGPQAEWQLFVAGDPKQTSNYILPTTIWGRERQAASVRQRSDICRSDIGEVQPDRYQRSDITLSYSHTPVFLRSRAANRKRLCTRMPFCSRLSPGHRRDTEHPFMSFAFGPCATHTPEFLSTLPKPRACRPRRWP